MGIGRKSVGNVNTVKFPIDFRPIRTSDGPFDKIETSWLFGLKITNHESRERGNLENENLMELEEESKIDVEQEREREREREREGERERERESNRIKEW